MTRLLTAIAIAATLVVAGCAGQAHVDQDGVADVVEPFLTIGTKNGERSLLDNYREAAPDLMIGTYFTTGSS